MIMHKDQLDLITSEIQQVYKDEGYAGNVPERLRYKLANRLADFMVLDLPDFVGHENKSLIKQRIFRQLTQEIL